MSSQRKVENCISHSIMNSGLGAVGVTNDCEQVNVSTRGQCLNVTAATSSNQIKSTLKCHCDEIFQIHCFCILWIFKWYSLTCPSRFVQQAREDAFFHGFSREFFVRHYLIMFLQPHKALLLCDVILLTNLAHTACFAFTSVCSSQLTGFETWI